MLRTAEGLDLPMKIVKATVEVNDQRKRDMAQKIIDACGGSLVGRTVAVLGLTFKPNTDDMRDSPSLDIIPALLAAGARVRAHDPEGMDEARGMLDGVEFCDDAYDALVDADALAIITEWNAYRALDIPRVKELMKAPVMVDMRNIYDPANMRKHGFSYFSIGRPAVQA